MAILPGFTLQVHICFAYNYALIISRGYLFIADVRK